jgi:hypothetical protein
VDKLKRELDDERTKCALSLPHPHLSHRSLRRTALTGLIGM